MLSLPGEIIEYVGSYLDVYNLHSLKSSCKRMNRYLTRLYSIKVESLPWRIVIHAIDTDDRIIITNTWITLGNYRKNYNQKPLSHEVCSECEYEASLYYSSHNNFYIDKRKIHSLVKEGIGGKTARNILNLKTNTDFILISFSELWYYDGLYSDDSEEWGDVESLKLIYDLFMPHSKSCLALINEAKVYCYPVPEGERIDEYYSKSNVVWGPYNVEKSVLLDEDLGDYNLNRYRNGVYLE